MGSSATAQEFRVYLGFWINWTYGRIQGSTLTVSTTNGALIVAVLALFVGVAGRSLWRIACFAFHHSFSTMSPQDGLYHQRQAILRNASTASDGVFQLCRAINAWQGKTRGWHRRLIPFTFFAASCSALFILAGTFSSKLYMARTNEVLLSGVDCAYISPNGLSSTADDQITNQHATTAQSYALQCYNQNASVGNCGTYVKRKLQSTVLRNASCPFSDEICQSKDSNLLIDTGYLNSHHDFGINAPPSQRWLYRTVTHCAPLVTEGYQKLENISTGTASVPIMRYYYGPLLLPWKNETLTYQYPYNTSLEGVKYNSVSTAIDDYTIGSLMTGSFAPIPALQRNDSQIFLHFLSDNNVRFLDGTSDPWFSATTNAGKYTLVNKSDGSPISRTYFKRDRPANALGCTVQEQYCNPTLPEASRCEPLRAADSPNEATEALWSDPKHNMSSFWSLNMLQESHLSMWDLVNVLGAGILLARRSLGRGIQQPLPSNQWQLEIEHWHSTSLASLQGIFVDAAVGTRDPALEEDAVRPKDAASKSLCGSQKIQTNSFSSFSVLGMALILGLGSLIILIDQSIEAIYMILQKRYKFSAYGRLEWAATQTLQLQRLAHEAAGSGTWADTDRKVPVTVCEEELAGYDIEDLRHPKLVRIDTGATRVGTGLGEEEWKKGKM